MAEEPDWDFYACRIDEYAASIVLWELLTGERLFHADDEISTFRKAMETVAAPPSSVINSRRLICRLQADHAFAPGIA